MFSRLRQRIQNQFGLTKSEAGIVLFLCIGLLIGGSAKLIQMDQGPESFDFRTSDSLFAAASAKVDSIVAADEDTTGRDFRTSQKLAEGSQIDLNVANIEDLMMIPGVGKITAQRIVEFRMTNGKFKSVEELGNVKGIGLKKLEKIRPFVKAE